MKNVLQKLITKHKDEEAAYKASRQAEKYDPNTGDDLRNFLKKTALGGIAISGFM
jgi:hypothetical protein